ncbi:Tex family protein [Porticoccus litoralis]|uniref:Tex family protein n=1 Tax=Porticoccus litoralis TaxID=434086 RepID=A0AAW8B1M9_9GAMM|nr:Tex family protein [Porticoccus litoralis]MDP1519803.1 Tex family protein [Porticoccus litoralis]
MEKIQQQIADELNIKTTQVTAAVQLLDEGATVPFISRYRKEVTGGLDDTQLRTLEERLGYLRDMEERRTTILGSIEEQGKLTPELKQAILNADTKTRLEDLYLPYKPKRRTKGQIAIEAGLEPLADILYSDPTQEPEQRAAEFVDPNKGVPDVKAALEGAKYILMERFSEEAELLGQLRAFLASEALISASVITGKETEGEKFRDYFEHSELWKRTPSHRALAMFRGRREGILSIRVDIPTETTTAHPCETMIASHLGIKHENRPADNWLAEVVRWTWKIKLHTHIETDLLAELRERAEADAITVFATNLQDLLLAAPAGQRVTIGLDPGLRTGVKLAVVDNTGKVLDHGAIFPTPPQNKVHEAEAILVKLCQTHQVTLIAIGNGTASRETERFVKDVLKRHPELSIQPVIVNEAGASVYSASEFAAREFPDLDVTIRGAISIARRLQDPLAELVKIDPKSIGVGQYQHDVSQIELSRSLNAVVEDCVNAVGVEVNTASAALLNRVAGLNQTIADNIVAFRDENGPFSNRAALKKVPRLGEKTFEQAAGFLRIANGDNPLDASAVHPESYELVSQMANDLAQPLQSLIGDSGLLRRIKPQQYVNERFGLPTITDILQELDKPGRDPRPEFKTATFKDGVESLKDLEPGMTLEGTVTNVTNFGAFVDIGVHQDGLVHISALAERFVKDPREVVKTGDIVTVKVMEVDIPRKRIGLSMRMSDEPGQKTPTREHREGKGNKKGGRQAPQRKQQNPPAKTGTLGALFAEALKKS